MIPVMSALGKGKSQNVVGRSGGSDRSRNRVVGRASVRSLVHGSDRTSVIIDLSGHRTWFPPSCEAGYTVVSIEASRFERNYQNTLPPLVVCPFFGQDLPNFAFDCLHVPSTRRNSARPFLKHLPSESEP